MVDAGAILVLLSFAEYFSLSCFRHSSPIALKYPATAADADDWTALFNYAVQTNQWRKLLLLWGFHFLLFFVTLCLSG